MNPEVMTDSPQDDTDSQPQRRQLGARILWLWVLIVLLYFLWEGATYRGLFARAAEWQLTIFGQYMPTLTVGLLVFIFASPALLMFRRKRARRAEGEEETPAAVPDPLDSAVRVGTRVMKFLFGIAGALLAAALACLLWTLTFPSASGPVQVVTLGTPAATAPREGPTRLIGAVIYDRTTAFSQGLPLIRRGARYAPVVTPGAAPAPLRYFVELGPQERIDPHASDQTVTPRTGILTRGGLPGAIVRLYRYAGYQVEWPYYVLFASPLTMRWPLYVAAMEFTLAALVFLICALFQRRHVRRLRTGTSRRRSSRKTA